MKKTMKLICLALALVMLLALAACGGGSAKSKLPTVSEGNLTMATNAQFPPYEFYEGDKIVGIDAEIAAAIAEKLGLELVIEDMEFDSIITAVKAGKADIGMAGMTVTDERKESVDFTTSYSTGVQALKAGKVDCVVIDNEPAKAFVAEVDGLKILDTEYALEDYAGAMSKSNAELYKAVDDALKALIADGTVAKIVGKYIAA